MVEKIKAGGGVVFRRTGRSSPPEVLLIYRNGCWDLPKGKLEEKERIEECAVREVAEEVGLSTIPKIDSFIGTTYHEYEREGIHYGKTTYWYSMELREEKQQFHPQTAEGIERAVWYPLSEARRKVDYENLAEILEALS